MPFKSKIMGSGKGRPRSVGEQKLERDEVAQFSVLGLGDHTHVTPTLPLLTATERLRFCGNQLEPLAPCSILEHKQVASLPVALS